MGLFFMPSRIYMSRWQCFAVWKIDPCNEYFL